jgi:hypothetical protein
MLLREEKDAFVVQHSAKLNLFFAGISFVLAICFLATMTYSPQILVFILLTTVLPTVYFIKNALFTPPILKINRFGIFNGAKLITNWANYKLAYLTLSKQSSGALSDDYIFITEFYKDDKLYTAKLKLPQLLNVGETDIIAAIAKYSTHPNPITILPGNTTQAFTEDENEAVETTPSKLLTNAKNKAAN